MIPQQCTDDRYPDALACVRSARYISIAHIQRTLQIGYNRAERLMWALSDNKVVVCVPTVQGGKWRLVK